MKNLIEKIVLTLKTPHLLRTKKQVNTLIEFISELSFFKLYLPQLTEDILQKASEFLTHESYEAGNYVFKSGDYGNKFYVILEGSVQVLVPSNENSFNDAGILTKGMSFGEYALLYNQPRLASIMCVERSHLLVLSKENYIQILGKIESKRLDELVKLLRSFQLFKNWSKGTIIKISYFFNERTLSRKSVLFREGDPITEVFFIKQGELELFKSVEEASPGKGVKTRVKKRGVSVSILSSGEVVGGEVLTTDKHSYTCKVYTLVAQVLAISKKDFCLKVKNEESQNFVKKSNESKEKERKSRVNSLERIKHINHYENEERTKKVEPKKASKSPKLFLESPEKKRAHYFNENSLKRIISRSRIDLNTNSEVVGNQNRFSPFSRLWFRQQTEKKYIYPIRIEQKQIIDRYKTPEVKSNILYYL